MEESRNDFVETDHKEEEKNYQEETTMTEITDIEDEMATSDLEEAGAMEINSDTDIEDEMAISEKSFSSKNSNNLPQTTEKSQVASEMNHDNLDENETDDKVEDESGSKDVGNNLETLIDDSDDEVESYFLI